jgi:hypothetical protein
MAVSGVGIRRRYSVDGQPEDDGGTDEDDAADRLAHGMAS